MAKCANSKCDVEFGLRHRKYECSGCGKYFCVEHVCDSSYVGCLAREGLDAVEKAIDEKGHLCFSCLAGEYQKIGIPEEEAAGVKTCSASGCGKNLGGLFTGKSTCAVCGRTFCSDHICERDDVDNRWLVRNERFRGAEGVCSECREGIDTEHYDNRVIYHDKAYNLRFVAGTRNGKRKAVLVHGILSGHMAFDEIGRELVRCGAFDVVWALDDLVYQGRVNEAKRVGLSDFITTPDPVSILKTIGVGLTKAGFLKALTAIDLPAYIVEGAARNLALTLRLLGWKGVTIIGHSLGGIVARCAVESYDLTSSVDKVITLGSPFRLWLKVNKPKLWNPEALNMQVGYLALVGKGDWVVAHRSLGNLTENDSANPNVLKILIEDADHTSIHSNVRHNNVAAIIKAFVLGYGSNMASECFRYFQRGDDRYVSDKERILGMSPVKLDNGIWHETCFSENFGPTSGMVIQMQPASG
ncbi:MAG: alpha/beta fold hydrolase [Gammaproteobacteria bacterium]|nr:MAG: alpha/beta fold hydrolase [Gammaproteobacteria bacterium]